MKNIRSLLVCLLIGLVMLTSRFAHPGPRSGVPLKVTEWDAFGYYIYLPSLLIYHDHKSLDWLPSIDAKYAVTGGNGWQAIRHDNGNYVFKYLGGVALIELPAFCVGHILAGVLGYPQDGFSPPYQYSLSLLVLSYCLLAVFLLRRILLLYFNDLSVALSLLLLCLASNFLLYAAIDNGQSHAYIFPLYVLVLYAIIKWHRQPRAVYAAAIGYVVGLATICRPTEAIMLFLPLLWETQDKESARRKWQKVKEHKAHILVALFAGFAGILPQLLYWKNTTGSFIYDVGSKWDFLNPHFRVLFGWEKGWFIYTPVTLFFVLGLFFIKKFPFRKSALLFCLLNIWIIIGWHEWRYGGSYSTRALMQSYPVFALPFTAFVERMQQTRWRIPLYALWAYLLFVNLFQIDQYCKTVIHYDDMNRAYYSKVYLNSNPGPLHMSLLDTREYLQEERGFELRLLPGADAKDIHFQPEGTGFIMEGSLVMRPFHEGWLKVKASIKAPSCLWQSYLCMDLQHGDSIKQSRIRLFSPISQDTAWNDYAFYMLIPSDFDTARYSLTLKAGKEFTGKTKDVSVELLWKR